MGAAAGSIKMLYKDALSWFKQYIDTETYMEDFKSMDTHNENALSFADVKAWITLKAKKDESWNIFLTGPVLTIAHKYACKHGDTHTSVSASKMVNVTEFKTLLVQLFAISILWSHFKNAEKWEQPGEETDTSRLNFNAFKLACRTFDSAHAHEDLSDTQIQTEYEMIDTYFTGSVGFVEICKHCCSFIDDPEVEKKVLMVIPKFFGEVHPPTASDGLLRELHDGPKSYYEVATIDQKNHEMITALFNKLVAQDSVLKSAAALEHQCNTRKKYVIVDKLINHPITCGFLLKFCHSQFSAENLTFIRAVDEYRDMFSVDNNMWTTDWKDIDATVMKEDGDELSQMQVSDCVWPSLVNKDEAGKRIDVIMNKYLCNDASTQVCISEDFVKRTKKRIKLLHLYGPSVFEEACIDPILTINKDILPRFMVSDIANRMVMRVASCEPPPTATTQRVPLPGNLLLMLSKFDDFPDTRNFALNEVIGSQSLYTAFFEFLQKEKSKGMDRLLCIRKINIYEELMNMHCMREASEQAWQIFRYFVSIGSAFYIGIDKLELKHTMLDLAVPKSGMFESTRIVANNLLQTDFEAFTKTAEYRGLPRVMREQKIDGEKSIKSRLSVDVSEMNSRKSSLNGSVYSPNKETSNKSRLMS